MGSLIAQAFAFVLNLFFTSLMHLATWALQNTLFHTVTLNPGSALAQVVWPLYEFTAGIGVLLLVVIVAYGYGKLPLAALVGRVNTPPGELVPRAAAALGAILVAPMTVNLLLAMANALTDAILQRLNAWPNWTDPHALLGQAVTALGTVVGATAAWDLLQPILWLALAVIVLWVVVSWVTRLFEIVFFLVMLPLVTPFVALNETLTAWQTHVGELVAAIFYQPAQVAVWYVTVSLLGNAQVGGLFGAVWVPLSFLMGLVGLFYMARVPSILRQYLGHGLAAGGLVGGEVAGGYLAARGVMGAWRSSKGAQLTGALQDSWMQRNLSELYARTPGALGRFLGGVALHTAGAVTAGAAGVSGLAGTTPEGAVHATSGLGNWLREAVPRVGTAMAPGRLYGYLKGRAMPHRLLNELAAAEWDANLASDGGERVPGFPGGLVGTRAQAELTRQVGALRYWQAHEDQAAIAGVLGERIRLAQAEAGVGSDLGLAAAAVAARLGEVGQENRGRLKESGVEPASTVQHGDHLLLSQIERHEQAYRRWQEIERSRRQRGRKGGEAGDRPGRTS